VRSCGGGPPHTHTPRRLHTQLGLDEQGEGGGRRGGEVMWRWALEMQSSRVQTPAEELGMCGVGLWREGLGTLLDRNYVGFVVHQGRWLVVGVVPWPDISPK
jgi:hypothetical protein